MDNKYQFELDFTVRDYECDLQGIVNNAVYLNYLEHTRNQFLKFIGLDFSQMHRDGIDAVVTHLEIDYKFPLTSGDKFIVKLKSEKKGKLRFIFIQDIFRLPDKKHVVNASVTVVCLKQGKPIIPVQIEKAIAQL